MGRWAANTSINKWPGRKRTGREESGGKNSDHGEQRRKENYDVAGWLSPNNATEEGIFFISFHFSCCSHLPKQAKTEGSPKQRSPLGKAPPSSHFLLPSFLPPAELNGQLSAQERMVERKRETHKRRDSSLQHSRRSSNNRQEQQWKRKSFLMFNSHGSSLRTIVPRWRPFPRCCSGKKMGSPKRKHAHDSFMLYLFCSRCAECAQLELNPHFLFSFPPPFTAQILSQVSSPLCSSVWMEAEKVITCATSSDRSPAAPPPFPPPPLWTPARADCEWAKGVERRGGGGKGEDCYFDW